MRLAGILQDLKIIKTLIGAYPSLIKQKRKLIFESIPNIGISKH